MLLHFKDILQHFKFVNWWIGEFVVVDVTNRLQARCWTDRRTYLIKVQKVWAFFVKIEQVETSLNMSTIVKDDKSFPIHPPDQSYNGLKSILKEHPIFNTTIKIRMQLQKSFHPIVNWFKTKKFDVPLKFRIKIRDITPFRA